jgi:intein-encoded DNA endonuclease-like protein
MGWKQRKIFLETKDVEISKLYQEGKTCENIGKIVGCSETYVVKRLPVIGVKVRTSQDYFRGKKILGVIKNKRHHPEITMTEIVELYNSGLSGTEIALVYNVDRSCIFKRLRESGIKMRSSSDYTGNKHWRFKEIQPLKLHNRHNGRMKTWSTSVKERDGYKCRNCKSQKYIHAHHIIPYILCFKEEKVFDLDNGITLCRQCHADIHSRRISLDEILSKTK